MIYKYIELSKIKNDEVLFFIRIRGRESYFKNVYSKKIINLFESVDHYACISEYKQDADVHIDLSSIDRNYLFEEEYNNLCNLTSVESVIKRCRGLREIPYAESIILIYKAYLFFSKFFSTNNKIKLIVTGAVDNYIMDLMVCIGESYGVKFFGVTDSFMSPEYKLITVRGELNDVSDSDSKTIVSFKEKIISNIELCHKPKISKIFYKGVYSILSYYYRYLIRYMFKYKIIGDLGYEYRFAPYLKGFYSLSQIFALRYMTLNINNMGKSGKPVAYIPLHWYPEATTDYWIHSTYHISYFSSVMNTIKRLQKLGYEVCAKEHPHYYLSRENDFYKSLQDVNCLIISPFVCTKDIFEKVDIVVVWNGSTGIESLSYGKETFKVVNSYYGDDVVPNLLDNNKDAKYTDKSTLSQKSIERVCRSSFKVL
jgi:hypothetical protein